MRPTMEGVLVGIARAMASRSTCSRLQVGAVIALDGRILASGYNGAPAGMGHCEHPLDAGNVAPCVRAVHAEANALVFAARHGIAVKGARMVCTHTPCTTCAGLIVNAGIADVLYVDLYRSNAGLMLLTDAGLAVRRH